MYMIFVASLNENVKLANTLKEQMEQAGVEVKLVNIAQEDFPMYTSLEEEKRGVPERIRQIVEEMKTAEGYMFLAPEYNYAPPPVLISFINWVTRSYEDYREAFKEKKVQLATHSGGGGEDVMNVLRLQFNKLGAKVMPWEIMTNYKTPLNKESSKEILRQFIEK